MALSREKQFQEFILDISHKLSIGVERNQYSAKIGFGSNDAGIIISLHNNLATKNLKDMSSTVIDFIVAQQANFVTSEGKRILQRLKEAALTILNPNEQFVDAKLIPSEALAGFEKDFSEWSKKIDVFIAEVKKEYQANKEQHAADARYAKEKSQHQKDAKEVERLKKELAAEQNASAQKLSDLKGKVDEEWTKKLKQEKTLFLQASHKDKEAVKVAEEKLACLKKLLDEKTAAYAVLEGRNKVLMEAGKVKPISENQAIELLRSQLTDSQEEVSNLKKKLQEEKEGYTKLNAEVILNYKRIVDIKCEVYNLKGTKKELDTQIAEQKKLLSTLKSEIADKENKLSENAKEILRLQKAYNEMYNAHEKARKAAGEHAKIAEENSKKHDIARTLLEASQERLAIATEALVTIRDGLSDIPIQTLKVQKIAEFAAAKCIELNIGQTAQEMDAKFPGKNPAKPLTVFVTRSDTLPQVTWPANGKGPTFNKGQGLFDATAATASAVRSTTLQQSLTPPLRRSSYGKSSLHN